MKRTVTLEIDGKKYPLRKSLLAIEELTEVESWGSPITTLLIQIAAFMKAGAAYETYKKHFDEWALDEDGNVAYLTAEELKAILDDDDFVKLSGKLAEVLELAESEEIKAVETPEAKKSKKKG